MRQTAGHRRVIMPSRQHRLLPETYHACDKPLSRYHHCHVLQRTQSTALPCRYGDAKVEIAIETLAVLAGKLPPRATGLVMEWANRHQDELMIDWNLARQQAELKRIEPLE
jgi:hypothetical protein